MRLRYIKITGLFGIFDHSIALNTKERLTIIHGPNGVGKTTALSLLQRLFRKDFLAVSKIPFESIRLTFSNHTILTVTRHRDEDQDTKGYLSAVLKHKGKEVCDAQLVISRHSENRLARSLGMPVHAIEDIIPALDQVGPREWFDRSTGDMLGLLEVLLRYGDDLPVKIGKLFSIPDEIVSVLDSLPVYFIQTQRLLNEEPVSRDYRYRHQQQQTPPKAVVERWANDMSVRIKEILRQSGEVSASLDRQFPSTLLGASLPSHATESRIREIYDEQTAVRDRLMKAGLIDVEALVDLPEGKIDSSELKVLWFYFNDVRKKLSVFDELLQKIELFKEIINSRFLRKSFSVDREAGFRLISADGSPIPLSALSSGEQHELVLTYELLFRVKRNSLILIDEPELSLHVTWQHKFLDDITRISKLVDLDFLIATHSPSIIHDRTHLMVPLS